MPIDEEFLKKLPTSPGVYLMSDSKGRVLYVGKAANLRSRVRSYFVRGGDERPAVQYLVPKVDTIRTILTQTEKEALILENNLIKEHKPKYNVTLRDDKSFFSLRLNLSHPFPRLSLVRTQQIRPDGAQYFGPYSSARDARVTLHFIHRLFPLRRCTDRQLATCKRPCLNCQMKRCLCPCAGKIDPDEYARMVTGAVLLLQGRGEDLLRSLRQEMAAAAKELRFEEAARIRDRLAAVERSLESQNVSFFHRKDQDVIGLVTGEAYHFAVAVLSFRQGKLLSTESFVIRNPALEEEEVLDSCIKQYYGSEAFIPKEVLISHPIDQPELIEAWLSEMRGNKVTVRVPARGQGHHLISLALKNAQSALLRELHKDTSEEALAQVARKFHLARSPILIEGYDISNISGAEPVGVKVLFRNGVPDKSGYRQFKIRGFSDQDDPGMILQTMTRRLAHRNEDPLPDLFLIDGGKAQLNAATEALQKALGEEAPACASIAKPQQEGGLDSFYLPNRKNPVIFHAGDPALMLLMRIRDEAHRFAHKTHTRRRSSALIRSALDQVPGIGPKKRQALLKAFGSVKELMAASDEEITAVSGIGGKDVERIRAYFAGLENSAFFTNSIDTDTDSSPKK